MNGGKNTIKTVVNELSITIGKILDIATCELAEVLADFDLDDRELIESRDIIRQRISVVQDMLLMIINTAKRVIT